MHHTGSEDFEPAEFLQTRQPLPPQMTQLMSDFRGRFRKGEEARTETNLDGRAKHFLAEEFQRPFEVGQTDIFIDDKAFDLVEHGGMGCVIVIAVHRARADHADGAVGRTGLHGTSLYRRGLGPHEEFIGQIERVLHVSGPDDP